jgi:hypothetical protein
MPNIDDIEEENDVDTYDKYVGAHVRVTIGDDIRSGVVRCKREMDGTTRGRANANSMFDTRTYEITFPNGGSDEYTTNMIVLITQVRPAHKYSISPWEMIHIPGGDNAVGR